MAVYGIDLCTTYSFVAGVDVAKRPKVHRYQDGVDTTPSVVYFESPGNVVVGQDAKDSAVLDPDNVVSLIKRDMGHDVTRNIHGRDYSPPEISALILRKLASDVNLQTGDTVADVVITVPAYFGAGEREATRTAGELAGLNVIDIISEPIAAAITYGLLGTSGDSRILVYDLGGGTFDTTMISLANGDITVVCTDGDHELGGANWDERLVLHLAERFKDQHPDAGDPLEDKQTEQQLRKDAESVKKTLSNKTRHTITVTHGGRTARVEVTREEFEELTRDLLDRTVEITRRTIDTARKKGVGSYDHLMLVGGSAKMPAVAERLHAEFGVTPRLQDPDLSVAKGAALYAFEETYRRLVKAGDERAARELADRQGLSSGQREQMEKRSITTVASRAFGIITRNRATGRDRVAHLVEANATLPADVTQEFATIEDGQTSVRIQVMEQAGATASDEVEDNQRIGEGDLRIPPGKPEGFPISVTFTLDSSGLLHVMACENETGHRLELDIQIGGMSEEEVARARTSLALVQVD
jgi:molecular chaperone DnaK (HSP70)